MAGESPGALGGSSIERESVSIQQRVKALGERPGVSSDYVRLVTENGAYRYAGWLEERALNDLEVFAKAVRKRIVEYRAIAEPTEMDNIELRNFIQAQFADVVKNNPSFNRSDSIQLPGESAESFSGREVFWQLVRNMKQKINVLPKDSTKMLRVVENLIKAILG